MSNLLRVKGQLVVKSVLRLQSPSRACPRCGSDVSTAKNVDAVLPSGSGSVRAYSSSNSTKVSEARTKRIYIKKKKPKKSATSLTEVIEVTSDAVGSQCTTPLSKLSAKDVARCLENIPQASTASTSPSPLSPSPSVSSVKRMPLPSYDQHSPPSVISAMNYATSSSARFQDHFTNFSAMPLSSTSSNDFNFQDFEAFEHFAKSQSLVNPSSNHNHLVPEELLKSLSSPTEGRIFLKSAPTSTSTKMPTERDLIDAIDRVIEMDHHQTEPGSIHAIEDLGIPFIPTSTSASSSSAYSTVPIPERSKNVKQKARGRNMKKEEREKCAKMRTETLEMMGREVSMNKSLVSYLEMCVFTQQINRGFNTLNFYRNRNRSQAPGGRYYFPKVTDIAAFNILLHGYAAKGNILKVREIFRMILGDELSPTPQSFAALIECLGRSPPSKNNSHSIRQSIKDLEKIGYDIQDLFNKVTFEADQREVLLGTIRRVHPVFKPVIKPPNMDYVCSLLTPLNGATDHKLISQAESVISLEKLEEMGKKQLEMERKGIVTVKSIEKKDNLENLPHFREIAKKTELEWAIAIEEAFERNLNTLFNQGLRHKSHRAIGLFPFLKVLPTSNYVQIILQEIRKLAEGSETYSPGVAQLYRELGAQVLSRYQLKSKDEKGILNKVAELYSQYLKWYVNPSSENSGDTVAHNSRQMWQQLLYHPESAGPHVDIAEKVWPNSVLSSIGRFLYGIVMRDIKIDANVMKTKTSTKSKQLVPAFYSIFRMQGMHLKEEIKPHPALVKLLLAASRDELTFDTTLVPMLSPPLPWASIRTGGYLLSPAKIIRLPFQAHQQKLRLEMCPPEDMYPSLDSLNQLGVVPWRINQKILDTIIEVFNNKGDDSTNVPPPHSECPAPPSIDPEMTKQEKFKVHRERASLKRRKAEMYSLWCDALYKLSIANHFRDDILWFPHNMDFRGRVYPCPPHLNHLGADVARAILVFAQGKPLGPKGLDWLKLHLVNLTGLKKMDSIQQRLKFADDIMGDILDSADFPLTGRKWWASSDEPWQTLSCCIEIAQAIRSGDPSSYISHYPIHQDGSCNGLQHYAALGRDQTGAESVNLVPAKVPQDVYSNVAKLVETLREKDASNDVKIAQVLAGFVVRKVIKQTVMTTVYGVTRYGARLQIARQLKDMPDFPKEHVWPGSLYLVGRTFDSLQEMFTSTKLIQDWFTECARLISQVCGQNVEWVTPLGLPIVQPYFRPTKKAGDSSNDPSKLPEVHTFDLFERPNVLKQRNAFPPNFIHSLDSSHMMLTSLNCERRGITFVSVHDCYWTHPSTVEIMNEVCREQFVALHSEPILEDLSKFLVEKYSYRKNDFSEGGSHIDAPKHHLNAVLKEVPHKGTFDLCQVLDSVFFFS